MIRFLLILLLVCNTVWADGVQGLIYETFQGTGASPSINPLFYPTVRSTGISPNINYPVGSYGTTILGSGLADRVIVHWTGYIKLENTATYQFKAISDDGIIVSIDGIKVINSWVDGGTAYDRTGTPTTFAAGVHPIDVWYYENGGGQGTVLQWLVNGSYQVVPTTVFATDSTYWTPVTPTLCCGGSSATISVNPTHTTKINTFTNRTTNDSQVYIEQIGNSNIVDVTQEGSRNSYINYNGNGSFNDITIKQTANNDSQRNYVDLTVTGNSNTVDIKQRTSGEATSFTKSVFANVLGDNNSLIIDQKNSGSHYLNVDLSGGNKTVDILQQGSGAHQADITLSGTGARTLNLIQQGTTAQSYSINSSCATNCQAISVTQGQ